MEIYKRISSGNLSRWCFFYLLSVFLIAHAVSLQETAVGFIGGSAVLPCSSEEPPHRIQDIDVRWRKYDLNVYDIINGKGSVERQVPEYRNRSESFSEEYMRGNFSLKLNNLQHTDAGQYTCYIIIEESEDQTVELLLEERPERQLPNEGSKPRPEMIIMFISVLCICIIFSFAKSTTASF